MTRDLVTPVFTSEMMRRGGEVSALTTAYLHPTMGDFMALGMRIYEAVWKVGIALLNILAEKIRSKSYLRFPK